MIGGTNSTAIKRMFSPIVGIFDQKAKFPKFVSCICLYNVLLRLSAISALVACLSACTGAELPKNQVLFWYEYIPTTSDEAFAGVTSDNKFAIWIRAAYHISTAGTRLITEHMEVRDAEAGILSYRFNTEIDCISNSTRFLNVSGYYQRNLSGSEFVTLSKIGLWDTNPSDSIRKKITEHVCQN
jgi:hypothetical protein